MIPETEILVRLLIAAALGAVVGWERERWSQPAGLRTHIVVVVGSTLAMTLSINLAMQFRSLVPNGDPARLAAQVLSGIGFLGAGAILRFGATVRGLTTAASLWTMAVVGLAVGAGYYLTSAGVTAMLLFVLTLLNWVEKRLIIPNESVRFTVYMVDQPGIERQVRDVMTNTARVVESFHMNRNIHRRRVKIDALVKLHGPDTIEQLSTRLGEISGVRIIKHE
jgi:putative Mg2+ transporter-C (MgtC) family protein